MQKINRTEKEAKSISLMKTTIEKVENYPNHSYGMEGQPFSYKIDSMLNILYKMTQYSMVELKNYFTVSEAAAICDVENGVLHRPEINPKNSLYYNIKDACEYNQLDLKWDVDKDKLLEKIEKLTVFKAYMIELLTAKFWDSNSGSFTMKEIADIFLIDYDEDEK